MSIIKLIIFWRLTSWLFNKKMLLCFFILISSTVNMLFTNPKEIPKRAISSLNSQAKELEGIDKWACDKFHNKKFKPLGIEINIPDASYCSRSPKKGK